MNRNDQAENGGSRVGDRGRIWWRPVVLLVAVAAMCVAARAFGIAGRLGQLRTWLKGLGLLGPVVFVLIRAGAAVAVLPGSALTVAGGVLFGSVVGIICVSAGTTLGACLSFLVARYFARESVARWVSTKEKFQRIDELTGQYGAFIVALARLVPVIPFNVQNYGFGLTRVSFGTYAFWSWLCMLPGSILVVIGGDIIATTLARGRVPWPLMEALALTLVAMALLATYALLKLWRLRRASGPQHVPEASRKRS